VASKASPWVGSVSSCCVYRWRPHRGLGRSPAYQHSLHVAQQPALYEQSIDTSLNSFRVLMFGFHLRVPKDVGNHYTRGE
jgi:hypothetical protein